MFWSNGESMIHENGSLAFYITNVCNLNCDNCSFLNNYPVKGHQRWADNEQHCINWSKRMQPVLIFILGGEPMTNPDFLKWIHGVAQIWPNAEIRINTNGTLFSRWPTLYDELLPYKGRVNLSISGHNENRKAQEIETIRSFLRGSIRESHNPVTLQKHVWRAIYAKIKDETWPEIDTIEDYINLPEAIRMEIELTHKVNINDYVVQEEPVQDFLIFTDSNDMRVGWANWDVFSTSSIKFDPQTQTMTLHNSDPKKAVSICHGGACAYIKDGKYYKCQVMGILPDLIAQKFPLAITDADRQLILSYEPAQPDWSDEKLSQFIKGLRNKDAIVQCKFCPENKTGTKIFATTKKIKIIKQ